MNMHAAGRHKAARFQIYVPGAYLLVVLLLFAGHAQGAGHGKSLTLIPYLGAPTMLVLQWIFGKPQSLSVFAAFVLASTIQWFFIGWLLDRMRAHKSKPQA